MNDAAAVAAAGTHGRPPVDASVARDFDAVEALRGSWERFSFQRVDADIDFFTTFASTSPKVVRPHVVSIRADGDDAMVVCRLERTRLATSIGYKTLYEPEVRLLVVAHGGLTGVDSEALSRASVQELRAALKRGEADAALLPAVPTGSPLFEAVQDVPFASRQRFASTGTHWALDLPWSVDELFQSRSWKRARSYRNRLQREFGDGLSLELLDRPEQIDRIFEELESVASLTYQSALGVAFADTATRRRLVELALDRGWFRAYVLYLEGRPIAFWTGHLYARRFFIGTPGYDPELADYRLGTCLLLDVIEHLVQDEGADVLDYGFGDAEYKRRFGSASWSEADVLLFAPTFRGLRINLTRTAVLGASRLAKGVLERAGLAAALKKRWRRQLGGS
jgi:CelD/BcsL family acetyltransferase involved in cellulose biosynthesis